MANFDISSAEYDPSLRQLETSDPCHASTFNAPLGQLLGNDVALKRMRDDARSGLDDPGLALRVLFIAIRSIKTNLENTLAEKIDKTRPRINLDTQAAASTVDGKLYAAICALGWESEVITDDD